MMLRFIGTLCVGTLLLMSVSLWFGSQAVSPELASALQGALSRGVEGLRAVASLAPERQAAIDAPEPLLSDSPPTPEVRRETPAAREVRRPARAELAEIAELLPGWPAPFLESRQEEIIDVPEPAPGVSASSPDPEAWADRIRRMLAIYDRVGVER